MGERQGSGVHLFSSVAFSPLDFSVSFLLLQFGRTDFSQLAFCFVREGGGGGGGELKEEPRKRKKTVQSRKERSKVGKNTSSFASFFRFPTMAAVDVAFKLTCATLFATALASGAWLTASMVKGYNDAQEYQVRREERRELERSIRPRRREHKTSFFQPRHSFSPRPPTQKKKPPPHPPAPPPKSRPPPPPDGWRHCLF